MLLQLWEVLYLFLNVGGFHKEYIKYKIILWEENITFILNGFKHYNNIVFNTITITLINI